MFTAARRGPASIVQLARLSNATRCITLILPRPLSSKLPATCTTLPARDFSAFHGIRQRAAEAEIINHGADEVTAEPPPSDAQISKATQHGPVTRFVELQERGLVCPTLVKTLVEDMQLETMTQVQSLTINETLKGGDV